MPRKAESKTSWRPSCKWVAGAIGAGIVYGLGALGVDLGVVLQDVGEVVNVDLPDQQGLATALGGLVSFYAIPDDFCSR